MPYKLLQTYCLCFFAVKSQRQKFCFILLNQKQEEMNERLVALEKKGIGLIDDLSRQIENSLPLKNDNDLRKFESDLADDFFFGC